VAPNEEGGWHRMEADSKNARPDASGLSRKSVDFGKELRITEACYANEPGGNPASLWRLGKLERERTAREAQAICEVDLSVSTPSI
jgi:hypothetical protein